MRRVSSLALHVLWMLLITAGMLFGIITFWRLGNQSNAVFWAAVLVGLLLINEQRYWNERHGGRERLWKRPFAHQDYERSLSRRIELANRPGKQRQTHLVRGSGPNPSFFTPSPTLHSARNHAASSQPHFQLTAKDHPSHAADWAKLSRPTLPPASPPPPPGPLPDPRQLHRFSHGHLPLRCRSKNHALLRVPPPCHLPRWVCFVAHHRAPATRIHVCSAPRRFSLHF